MEGYRGLGAGGDFHQVPTLKIPEYRGGFPAVRGGISQTFMGRGFLGALAKKLDHFQGSKTDSGGYGG